VRAVSNAERRTAPEDMDTTGTGPSEAAGTGANEETRTVASEATGTGAAGVTLPTPQPPNPRQSKPPPTYEKVAGPEPASVKAEPLDEDQLDFVFAADVLASWNADEESDAALWKRMENMVRSLVFSSGMPDG